MPILAACDMLSSEVIVTVLGRIAAQAPTMRDRLNEADRHLGDGDTGMTVERVIGAMQGTAASGLPADLGAALSALASACQQATGSSLGAVIAIGLNAMARRARGHIAMSATELEAMLQAAIEAISTRSGAQPGDKTMLDTLVGIRAALAEVPADVPLQRIALQASHAALDAFRNRSSQVGRARVYGEKSAGRDDPGMLALDFLLRAAAGESIDA
jgi:dihydroxyacetone kinase-like protein